jgi:hypothetical protein
MQPVVVAEMKALFQITLVLVVAVAVLQLVALDLREILQQAQELLTLDRAVVDLVFKIHPEMEHLEMVALVS